MDLRDKRLWLAEHGFIARHDNDPDGSLLGIIWETDGGAQFRGTGRTRDEMFGNLYDVIKLSLWITCRDGTPYVK